MSPRILLALSVVYLAWGSSYLAVAVAVREMAALPFTASRFLLVGVLMLLIARWRKEAVSRSVRDWGVIAAAGVLFSASSGLVPWAQQWISSGQTALLMASAALWTPLLGHFGPRRQALSLATATSLVVGLGGVALIVGEGLVSTATDWPPYLALLIAPLCWAAGTSVLRNYPPASGASMTISLHALLSGLIFLTLADGALPSPEQWSPSALFSLGYLVLFGSLAGYTAYFWLISRVSPAVLGTFAYVNPLVAVLLGYLVLGETLSRTQWAGALLITASVAWVLRESYHRVPPE